ncbi:MAG: response regulator [Anaerolineae bacterium]|nr:response regulator [Anaerolineae bacterium]
MARILVVDDSLDMLAMLQMILEKRGGHAISVAHNGAEALEVAEAENLDMAIVDVMMPGMSGYEVVKRLRANPKTANLAICVLTARGQKIDREAALAAGADDHIAKPVKMEDLLARVEALLLRGHGGGAAQKPVPAATPSETVTPVATPAEPAPARPQPATSQAMLLPIISLRGGVGVTTVACNLAVLLQQIAPTVLVDLSPNSGHCSFFLGLRPDKHWGQYLEQPGTPVASLLLAHASGLKLMAAPAIPYQHGWFSDEDIADMFNQLQSHARFVIVDMPPVLNATAMTVLGMAHRIVLLGADDGPSIQSTRGAIHAMQPWISQVALARNAVTADLHLPLEMLQQALRARVVADLPYDPQQVEVLRKGVPLALALPNAPLVTGLKRLAKLLLAH